MSASVGHTYRRWRRVTVLFAMSSAVWAGCASGQHATQSAPGELPAGTAVATLNGASTGELHDVACSAIGGRTTLRVGTNDSGVTAVVDGIDGVVVDSVVINGLHGFSGSQWRGLEGDAKMSMVGSTYVIEGTAVGWRHEDPSHRAAVPFTFRTTC